MRFANALAEDVAAASSPCATAVRLDRRIPVLVGWSRLAALGTIDGLPVQPHRAASMAAAIGATLEAQRVRQTLESRMDH
jgi:hypothetical protein